MRTFACSLVLVLLFVAGSVRGAPDGLGAACAAADPDRPRIALVLGGGGARGGAHIGVIRALEELRVPVDMVVGTSIGALVGGLYATGMDAAELETVLRELDWARLFADEVPRGERPLLSKLNDTRGLFGPRIGLEQPLPSGAIAGQEIDLLFQALVRGRTVATDFSALPIPFRAVAADIETGEPVVLASGDLPRAMRASMSVPGAFHPVLLDDHLLVDGGIANNLPVDVVRALGADVVIAVDVSLPLRTREQIGSAVDVIAQITDIMVRRNTDAQLALLGADDVLLVPELEGVVDPADFPRTADGIDVGHAAAQASAARLAPLALTPAAWAARQQALEACRRPPERADFVRVDNRSRLDDAVVDGRIDIAAGDVIDPERIAAELREVHALGGIESARYAIVEEGGETGVVIEIDQDARGTRYLETGLDYRTQGNEDALDLRFALLDTAIDGYGSELRVTGQVGSRPSLALDVYKYLDPDQRWVVIPGLFAERGDFPEFADDDAQRAIVDVEQLRYVLYLGREFGAAFGLYGGLEGADGSVRDSVGESLADGLHFRTHRWLFGASFDRLDDVAFPSHGESLFARYLDASPALGADEAFRQVEIDATAVRTVERHTFQATARYATTLGNDAPVYARFRAGGFERLSGFDVAQRSGQHFAMALAGYRYRLNEDELALLPGFAGATVE